MKTSATLNTQRYGLRKHYSDAGWLTKIGMWAIVGAVGF